MRARLIAWIVAAAVPTPTTAGSRETENVGRSAVVLSATKAF